MKQYRYSPIKDEKRLIEAIAYIHMACHKLCKQSMGNYLPVAGNIGIFCHYDDEYLFLKTLQKERADLSDSVYGKYFRLYEPIGIPALGTIPQTTYTHLYIRKPDPHKPQVGDIDFYIPQEKYAHIKQSLLRGKTIKGARVLANRPDLDLIELYDPAIDALGFIGNKRWH